MATYVLVHGAWGSAVQWAPIAQALRRAGHEVAAAPLIGLGSLHHMLSPAITLSTHIADVAGLIDDEGFEDVILVGHSYGGMVITGTAASRPKSIRTLVYVDAFLPRDGEALWDIADAPSRQYYIDAQRDAPGLVAPFPGSPDTLTRHPLLTLVEPVRCVAGPWSNSYVYATQAAPTVFTPFYDRVREDPGWRVLTVPCGHAVMAEQGPALTAFLLAEADRAR